jgi:hypothetical protein
MVAMRAIDTSEHSHSSALPGLCALAARQAATAQLGPNLLDGIVKCDHVPSFCAEDGTSALCRSGRVMDAAGAAQRGAGEPILPSVDNDRHAPARALRSAKLGVRRER